MTKKVDILTCIVLDTHRDAKQSLTSLHIGDFHFRVPDFPPL